MKIVYYTDQVYMHGGLERVLANKLNYFSLHTDIKLHVITFQQEGKDPCYNINDKVIFHDLGITYDREVSFFNPRNILKSPQHFYRLKNKLKLIDPDVIVVCNYEYCFYFVPIISRKTINIKEYHSSRHFNFLRRNSEKSLLRKLMYKMSDYFESKYNYLALLNNDELKYYNSENKIVIPNSLTFKPDKHSELTNKRVISAGRIAPVKGYENLILIWEIVNKYYPDWILDIYGNGDINYINELNQKIHNLNLNGKVNLKGGTNLLKNEMIKSSIYAMTSKTECFPMVLLEAMSCGLPIISFDCPNGPRNIIENEQDGILVENNNIEIFAEKIITLIKENDKRVEMGKKGYINAKKFHEDIIIPNWLDAFGYKH